MFAGKSTGEVPKSFASVCTEPAMKNRSTVAVIGLIGLLTIYLYYRHFKGTSKEDRDGKKTSGKQPSENDERDG